MGTTGNNTLDVKKKFERLWELLGMLWVDIPKELARPLEECEQLVKEIEQVVLPESKDE